MVRAASGVRDAKADNHGKLRRGLDPGDLGADVTGSAAAAPVIPVIET